MKGSSLLTIYKVVLREGKIPNKFTIEAARREITLYINWVLYVSLLFKTGYPVSFNAIHLY